MSKTIASRKESDVRALVKSHFAEAPTLERVYCSRHERQEQTVGEVLAGREGERLDLGGGDRLMVEVHQANLRRAFVAAQPGAFRLGRASETPR